MHEFEILKKYVGPVQGGRVYRGAGDDCSLIEFSQSEYLVSGTDCLIEDIHFRCDTYSFSDIAYKTLAVNMSDLAAMGAKPHWAHLTLAIPSRINDPSIDEFFTAFQSLCRDFGIQLIGGDLSSSPQHLFINLHLSGVVKKDQVKLRENFRHGQVLCVTGALGDSAAGLFCLDRKVPGQDKLKKSHRRPPIELEKGLFLASQSSVCGMMDLSDGLASDLQRIPQTGFEVNIDKIPMSNELLSLANQEEQDPLAWALSGGEDYRLLFSCDEKELESLQARYKERFEQELFVIGRTATKHQQIIWLENGKKVSPNFAPFTHFK